MNFLVTQPKNTDANSNYPHGEYAFVHALIARPEVLREVLKKIQLDKLSRTPLALIIREAVWCVENKMVPFIGEIEEGLRIKVEEAHGQDEQKDLHRAMEIVKELEGKSCSVETTNRALDYGKSLGPRIFALTDSGNAELFVEQHGHRLCFCPELGGWLIYRAGRWQLDRSGLTQQLSKQTVRSRYAEASVEPDDKKRAEILAWAKKSESRMKRKDMLELAQNEPGMRVQVNDFDTHPFLFNCVNGTLNLQTGILKPHDARDFLTQISPVIFDEGASCPVWQKFLSDIFAGEDRDQLIDFIRRFVGYILTGDTREQCFFIGWGVGSNGKSTLLQVIRWLLGDYAAHAKTDTFTVKRSEGVNNDLARLRGARFVSAVETDEGKRLAESLIKEITGGDPVTARFLFKEYFEYPPQFKVFLATNHKPEIRGTDNGIWRRVRLIPFEVRFWNAEAGETGELHLRADKTLLDRLQAELPGIMAWAVQGCLDWQESGLSAPEAVVIATTKYREEQDVLAQFIEDCCVLDDRTNVSAKLLNVEYRAWCERNGEKPLSTTALGRRLRDRGFKRHDTALARGWRGIGLKTFEGEPRNGMTGLPLVTGDDTKNLKQPYKDGHNSFLEESRLNLS